MTPEHAFLDSIWEDLDDDATKLIFADWLEERDDWRGQLLRWQVERNQHGFWTTRFQSLHGQITTRLFSLGKDWLAPFARYTIRYSDGTGLLWLKMSPDELARLPEPRTSEGVQRWVTEVSLERCSLNSVLAALERGPEVRVFLNFSQGSVSSVGQRLAASPGLGRVRSLDLTQCSLAARDLGALLASPAVESLQYLFLGYSRGLQGAAGELLASARHLFGLRGLDLAACGVTDAGLARLAEASALAGVTALYLERNNFGPAGLEALTASRYLARLRVLDLRHCGIDPAWPATQALQGRFPFATF